MKGEAYYPIDTCLEGPPGWDGSCQLIAACPEGVSRHAVNPSIGARARHSFGAGGWPRLWLRDRWRSISEAAAVCFAGFLLLTACSLGPDYERPELPLPAQHHLGQSSQSAPSLAELGWWELFQDPALVQLIEQAVAGNLDLQLAAARIAEARARVTSARAGALPNLGVGLSASRGNDNLEDRTGNSFFGGLSLSWELDLWGRYARATEAARAALLATEYGRQGVVAALTSGVAQQHLLLQTLREQLEILQRTSLAQSDSLRLVSLLARQGVQSAAEERQAESQLLTTNNQIPAVQRGIVEAENALAVLLGLPPASFPAPTAAPALRLPPQVPVGLPAELIERRPDIRQAEQELIAANADVGVARTLFFPDISLTGLLGGSSDALSALLDGRSEHVHSLGADILQPLYAGGAIRANYRVAMARLEQAALAYRQTVLTALREVSDALAAYQYGAAEVEGNRRRVSVAQEVLRLSNLRFRAGVISYLDVLDAQRQLLAAELDLSGSELEQRLALVRLYRALGGGWGAPSGMPRSVQEDLPPISAGSR